MNILGGKITTKVGRKINEIVGGINLLNGYRTTDSTAIASINAGNIGEVVAAAGTTQANATALSATKFIHKVTGANATVGVRLPVGVAGMTHIVLNTVNAVLNIYPATGQEIENSGANVVLAGVALYGYIFQYVDLATGWESTRFLLVAS